MGTEARKDRAGRRVLKNVVALALSNGVERLFTFGLTVYIARALGKDVLGQFTIVMSLALIFQTISYLGQEQITIREVARAPSEAGSYLLNGSLIVAGGGLLGTLLMFVTANVLDYEPQVVAYTYVVGLSLIPGALSIVGESVVQGLEQMHYVTIARAISGGIKLILSIPLLYFGVGLWSIFLVIALSNFALYLIYLWIINRPLGPNNFRFDRALIRHLLHLAGTFSVISVFGVVFKQVDVLMLGRMKDLATVGLYSAAYRMVRLGMQLLPVFMLALFPHMSEVHARFPERLGGITAQVTKLLMVLVIPLAVIATVLAEEIISLVYGPDYQAAAPVLRALAWMVVLFSANSVLFRTMLASDNERVTMRIAGVNMVSSVLLNLLLIPHWGASGVAVASLCTTLIALLQNYGYVARHLFTLNWAKLIGKPGLAAAVLGSFLFAVRGSSMLVSLPLGITLYVAMVFVLRVFSPEELDFLRRVLTDAKARISL